MREKDLRVPWILREMYRHCKPVYYLRGSEHMYMARVELKSEEILEVPFTCEDGTVPYDFVLKFMLTWLWLPAEVHLIELFQNNIYQESYTPSYGWFKKRGVP